MFGLGLTGRHVEQPEINSVYVSETGLVRPDNQDGVMVSPRRGMFCVADGIGGGEGGGIASSMVCSELGKAEELEGLSFARRITAVQSVVARANGAIVKYAAEHSFSGMGTTVAVLLVDAVDRSRAAAIYVGDSRIYRIRRGMAVQLTRDHKSSGTGWLSRAVGAQPTVRCDVNEVDAMPGDRFIVCTDGVYGLVPTARIAVLAGGGSLESAAERLADGVIRAGATDNYSFILVEI